MHQKLDMLNLQKKIDTNIKVTMDDFRHALSEVRPAFGVDQDDFATYVLIPCWISFCADA